MTDLQATIIGVVCFLLFMSMIVFAGVHDMDNQHQPTNACVNQGGIPIQNSDGMLIRCDFKPHK